MINEDLNLLLWNLENGADEPIGEEPVNYFAREEKNENNPKPLDKPENQPIVDKKVYALEEQAKETQAALKDVKTLDELKRIMLSFTGCTLKTTAMNTVFGAGIPNSKVMLVGEAPGADEDRIGLPFVGLSGKLLDKMLASIGLSREENVYISNILPWRPPGNRTPTSAEVALCLPFIRKHIELINPDILVLLGGSAATAILETAGSVSRMRGRWLEYTVAETGKNIDTLVTFHPAFLLRSASQKRTAWKDMLTLKQKLNTLGEN